MDVSEREPETNDALLNDTGELDGAADSAVTNHLAKCGECSMAVTFHMLPSGASFVITSGDPDAVFGMGSNHLPLCPNGHGEMSIADDKIPAADAFADAQSMLLAAEGEAIQRSLPGVFPPFNFEGAYLELERQALTVDQLHREHKAAAEEARDAKKNWDKAAELYTSMALELRRRRREKDGEPRDDADERAGAASGPLVPCTWEQKCQNGEPCPLCRNKVAELIAVQILGETIAPPDAAQHADDVERLIVGLDVDATADALDAFETFVDRAVIAEWSDAERASVRKWANASYERSQGSILVDVPERPKVLGKPHVPSKAMEGEHQVCSLCEVVIHASSDAGEPYDETDMVGVDCPGKVVAANRYPSNRGKKTAAAAKKIAPQPKPKAGKKKAKR